jgi:uncharacterized protein (TIGR02996 family)
MTDTPEGRRVPAAAALGLFLVVFILYLPAIDFRLIGFDDQYFTRDNHLIRDGLGLDSIRRAFTELPTENLFIPMTHLSLMADVSLFGFSPRGFHLTGILLFAIDSALILLLLRKMTGETWKSAFAAALVALHPLRVENAAWVSERKGVLAVFFFILVVWCHVNFARSGKWRWYAAALACAALGMLAKPLIVTLPVLLLLVDYWPLRRLDPFLHPGESLQAAARRIAGPVVEKVPLFLLSAVVGIFTIHLQSAASLHQDSTFLSNAGHACAAVLVYLKQTLWPSDLAIRYFKAPWEAWAPWQIPSVALVAGMVVLAFRNRTARPWLSFGIAWFLLAIFPNSGIIPTGVQWISDRLTWVPHIGFAVAVTWLADDVLPPGNRRVRAAIGISLLVVLALLTCRQLMYWKDGSILYRRGAAYANGDPRFLDHYALELDLLGRYPEALEISRQTLHAATDPVLGPNIQANHLMILNHMGARRESIEAARGFLARTPGVSKTRLFLADALLAEGRHAEAIDEYRAAVGTGGLGRDDTAYALEGLGIALMRTGRDAEAAASFEAGLALSPRSASLNYNMARLLAAGGRGGAARTHFEAALRAVPGDRRVRLAFAELLLENGSPAEGVEQLRIVAGDPRGGAEAVFARGRILETSGDRPGARSLYEKALADKADHPETHDAVRRRLANRR